MVNFGKIKMVCNQLLSECVINKDRLGKEKFKLYIKTINENRVLKDQFNLYYLIENKIESDSLKALDFVNESISLFDTYSLSDIEEANNKLLSRLNINDFESISEGYDNELYDNICTVLTTKKNSKTIDTIIEAKRKIVDYILNNKPKEKGGEGFGLPNSVLSEITINKFNETYAELNEDVRKVISLVIEGDDSNSTIFYKALIDECLTIINDKLKNSDVELKEKLLSVKENLLNRSYNNETFVNDVSKVLELRDTLKTE